MRVLAALLACLFLFCSATGVSFAQKKRVRWVKSKHGVKALIQLSKSQASMVKAAEKETRNYNKVKQAIAGGTLEKGKTAASVRKTIGEPVIILSREGETLTKWIYKPGYVTVFSDKKVYLIFNEDDELIDWKDLEEQKEGEE
ncbi:MAG: hypothetical protein ACE5JK_02055 [Candidatus Omnitrophota bacterium]